MPTYAVHIGAAYGLNIVATGVLIGSGIALAASFIVTHAIEKLCLKKARP
jgi:HAMP domain-containing protein